MLYQQPRDRMLARELVPFASPAMILTPEGLMLGAGTILVPAEGTRKLAALEGRERQVLALLSAAYGRAVAPSVLGNIERAAKCWSVGDDFTAHLHLAHTGLRALDDFPRSAHRLRMAKGALDHGASPRALFAVLRIDRQYIDALEKRYNPAQPRVPAGYPDGGQWTVEDATSDNLRKPVAQYATDEKPATPSLNQGPEENSDEPWVQYTQWLPLLEVPPIEFFSRPPVTPLEELPKGSAGGDNAGARFSRSTNEQNRQQNPNCYLCGRPTTREPGPDQYNGDHIIPRAQGGNNDPTNLGTACRTCNLQKGNRTPQEYVPRFYFDPVRGIFLIEGET